MRKHLITLLLLAAMLLSCGNAAETKTESVGESVPVQTEETKDPFDPELPEKKFNGYEFRFLQFSVSSYAYKLEVDLLAEEQTGATINDAVYDRNMNVCEQYDIAIRATYGTNFGDVSKETQRMYTAGEDAYDVVNERLYEVAQLITSGTLLDIHLVPYVQLAKPWWDSSSEESLEIGGKLYTVGSDIYLSDKYATSAVLFNKQLAVDYQVEDIYELVNNGNWTMDKISEISSVISNDTNGDGQMTKDDLYGMLGRRDMTTFFFHGGNGRLAILDENGLPQDSFYTDRNIDVVYKVFDILYDENLFFNVHRKTGIQDSSFYELFRDGHSLFYVGMLLDEVEKLRDSDTDFGIVPNPKYDQTQEKYHSTVSIHHTGLLSVPATSTDLERTGIILEAMSAASRKILQPAYYETALKGKAIRDEESAAMLDIIFGNRVFDVGEIMNFGNFGISFICISTDSGSSDIASLYASHQEKIAADMEKFIEAIEKLP